MPVAVCKQLELHYYTVRIKHVTTTGERAGSNSCSREVDNTLERMMIEDRICGGVWWCVVVSTVGDMTTRTSRGGRACSITVGTHCVCAA
eukprot:9476696-Pyramimonas_sp.AAC.2